MKQYPKWLYHATEKAQIVADHAAHLDLGPGWFESQGEADAGVATAKAMSQEGYDASDDPNKPSFGAPPSDAAATSADVSAAPAAPTTALAADEEAEAARVQSEKDSLYATPVAKVIDMLKNSSKETLLRVANYEAGNPKGARSSLVKAIDAALKKLEQ